MQDRQAAVVPREASASKKARGAFFTPPSVANFLVRWAIRSKEDRILEPSCGEAAFLGPSALKLAELGADSQAISDQLFGVDIYEPSLRVAREILMAQGVDPNLHLGSFFELDPPGGLLPSSIPAVDAVVGNPPFVRYQQFAGSERARAQAAALRQGVSLNGLASSWAALMVHASAFLKPRGRLAIVLPAELLTVNYSEPIRRFLLDRFASVDLIHFKNLVFEDALEDVVLLLAEGSGGCSSLTFHLVEAEEQLAAILDSPGTEVQAVGNKWTSLLMDPDVRDLFTNLESEWFVDLSSYGAPELGNVTGANDFFTLRPSQVADLGLSPLDITRISPPGTRHLKGLSFGARDWNLLAAADERVWLLTLTSKIGPSHPAWPLIVEGEAADLHLRYKCRIRDPWYCVPKVKVPDLFFTYMSHRFPKIIANAAGAGFLNSMHGITVTHQRRVARATLPLLAPNTITQLGAELAGRSYGGGILKMEPSEASRLPLPRPNLLVGAEDFVRSNRARLDRELRTGNWEVVVDTVDEFLLSSCLGVSPSEIQMLREGLRALRDRRLSRGSGNRKKEQLHP